VFVKESCSLLDNIHTFAGQKWVISDEIGTDPIRKVVALHSYIHKRILQPRRCFLNVGNCPSDYFCIEMVSQLFRKVGFNRNRSNEFVQVSRKGIQSRNGVASPSVSNWGRPARPKICCTSRMLKSTFPPFSGL